MSEALRPFAFVTVVVSLSACLGQDAPEGTGFATAEIQVVPAGVGCLRRMSRVPGATADTTRNFTVTPGTAATLDLGYLAADAYSIRPSAFNVACASVVAATVPSWSGAPVDATIVAGNATTVFVSQLNSYFGSAQRYAAMQDESVRAWGSNPYGQFGDGSTSNRFVPTRVAL